MKITAVLVLKCSGGSVSDPVVLANATDVSHLGFFQRGFAKEFILFAGRELAQSAPPAQLQSVHFPEYEVHSYNRNGLCAVAFMDAHFPVRSAFSLLNKVLDEYQKNFGDSWRAMTIDSTQPWPYLDEALTKFQDHAKADELLTKIILVLDECQKNFGDSWRAMTIGSTQRWPYLDEALTKFQDPAEADKLLKIQRAFDEIIIILHKTIDSVLARGEKLDSLVEKSSDLSAVSQMFYKQAKKTNQYCAIL